MSRWQDLVTASLIGTERSAVPDVAVPGLPTPPGAPPDIPFPDNPAPDSRVTEDPAALLLDRAALLTAARRGGRLPGRAEPPPAAEPDPRPAVSQAAAHRLARMLGEEHRDLLAEWLAAVAARGLRVPARLLPALLDRAQTQGWVTGPRHLVAEAGGARARWLARLNPQWRFLLAETGAGDDAWRLGTPDQRRRYLTALRARDPGAARKLIAESWAAAGPDERVMFVRVLADGLSLADEPLLEIALDHGNAWARKMAAEVLATLPGSALARRMAERALGCLSLHQGSHGTRLVVTPPAQCDSAMRRDGITPGPGALLPGPASQGHLLLEVLARTSLRTWTDEFGRPAEEILALPSAGWAPVLAKGWSQAAIAQCKQDPGAWTWMAALISWSLAEGRPGMTADAGTLGQLARRADPALGAPGALPDPHPDAPPALHEAVGILRFRYEMLKELDHDHADG